MYVKWFGIYSLETVYFFQIFVLRLIALSCRQLTTTANFEHWECAELGTFSFNYAWFRNYSNYNLLLVS